MSYDFIKKIHEQMATNVDIEGCSKPFSTVSTGPFVAFTNGRLAYNQDGLKFHVRIADQDIYEALKIIAQTTQKHNVGFFKVMSRPFSDISTQKGKQFTIYIDESKMNAPVLNAFVNDLESRLAQANIRPNEVGENLKIGDKFIPNSSYISYRYDKSKYLLDTKTTLLDFLHQRNIPYFFDRDEHPRFVYLSRECCDKLVQEEYLVRWNYDKNKEIIADMDHEKARIELRHLTSIRPSNLSYKPPLLKDILEHTQIITQKKNSSINNCLIVYNNTQYCELELSPDMPKKEIQQTKTILSHHNIDYAPILSNGIYKIRMPYSDETQNILTEHNLITTTVSSENDRTRKFLLDALHTAQMTQYLSSGRYEIAISPQLSGMRNEMLHILQEQGIQSKKIQNFKTKQYFLSLPYSKQALQFVKTSNPKSFNSVSRDYMEQSTEQRS